MKKRKEAFHFGLTSTFIGLYEKHKNKYLDKLLMFVTNLGRATITFLWCFHNSVATSCSSPLGNHFWNCFILKTFKFRLWNYTFKFIHAATAKILHTMGTSKIKLYSSDKWNKITFRVTLFNIVLLILYNFSYRKAKEGRVLLFLIQVIIKSNEFISTVI